MSAASSECVALPLPKNLLLLSLMEMEPKDESSSKIRMDIEVDDEMSDRIGLNHKRIMLGEQMDCKTEDDSVYDETLHNVHELHSKMWYLCC